MTNGGDPSSWRERTALAWTRSALNMAASGVLIARAAFTAHLDALALVSAAAMAGMALFTWRHGQAIDRGRLAGPPHSHPGDLMFLTAATILTAAIAMVLSIAA